MLFLSSIVLVLFSCGYSLAQHEHHNHMQHNHEEHRVNVAVYYESLCPDSRKFFTQQLYPSLQGNLSHYVNLTLVPYGKTTSELNLNEHTFTCHHGPNECRGNKIQACALRLIDAGQNTEGLGFNKIATGFINCLMDKADREKGYFPTMDCAQINHVANLNTIDNCVNHTDASNYLSKFGELTDKLQKPLQSVPTIVFNNVYNKEDSDLAQINFVRALCKHIPGDKPECIKSGAGILQMSFVVVAVSIILSKFFS
ncbi:unnamed protein product [Acanthoscelides obtectus]|uniref:Gamma-interferon-inducible lysosomal thiol reductase n=1 Tax=Acanthoscelides obtectus TaxID=200917 RepID=A0A9P0PHU9_ACAOB|nr:unnamed protein product [Acanthoscelides obtectus]CAK1678253.1 GILT-like protein 1 [Acanthoscelides obtectus]